MLSPYRTNPNNVKKRPKNAKIDDHGDLKRPQMTSNDNNKTKTKNNSKGGSMQENIEINEHYLDKVFKNNNS